MNLKILFIVAHTDDEVLSLGGTIAKHSKCGDKVFGISMTDGISSRGDFRDSEINSRQMSSVESSEILDFKWLNHSNFPDNALDTVPLIEIVREIEKAKLKIEPDIVYTHNASDLNIDHRKVCEATLTAFRPQPNETWSEIRTFEVPSATDYGHKSVTDIFVPNLFIDISETKEKKISAFRKYKSEIKDYPHSRSIKAIENLIKYRGNQVGIKYAEAFEILRKIERK